MTLKRLLAVMMVGVMVLALASCGTKQEQTPVTEAQTVADDAVDDNSAVDSETVSLPDESQTDAQATEAATEQASEAEQTEAPAEETTEEASKVPQTKEEIVEFYKAAAAATDKAGVKTSNKMTLEKLDGGSGIGSVLSLLEGPIKNALDKNSSTDDHITGGYKNLTADDVASATATDDGKYTTVTINLKEQTDGFSSDSKGGHVGHGISVLGNVQHAIDEIKGVDVDPSEGKISLRYTDAKITVKVDNATGRIVSGKWSYRCNVSIDNVKVKVGIIGATLKGASAIISQTITL